MDQTFLQSHRRGFKMKIEFTKEDIKKIRRIARQELNRFWYDTMNSLHLKEEEDIKEDLK